MSSAGQKLRKRYFVGEVLKRLDVRYFVSIVPRCYKTYVNLLRSGKPPTGVSSLCYSLLNCSVDYAYENCNLLHRLWCAILQLPSPNNRHAFLSYCHILYSKLGGCCRTRNYLLMECLSRYEIANRVFF